MEVVVEEEEEVEEEERRRGGSSFLTAEGDDGSPAGQCETPRVDPTQLASSQPARMEAGIV